MNVNDFLDFDGISRARSDTKLLVAAQHLGG